MFGEISKHFRFMETHVLRNHVNFQTEFDFCQHVKAKCHFNMYLSAMVKSYLDKENLYSQFFWVK